MSNNHQELAYTSIYQSINLLKAIYYTITLHLSQKLLKQHLLVNTASFITSLHSGQWNSGGRSPTERVEGSPSISLSKAALLRVQVLSAQKSYTR